MGIKANRIRDQLVTLLCITGAGKSSLCASIATGIAGFASKHPAYPEKNLENTPFMKLWDVRLSKYNHDKQCRATSKPIEDSSICMEYEVPETILFDNGDIREANITLETDESGQIIIRVTDCGGDEEYVFLTTLAITSKCLRCLNSLWVEMT